MLRDRDYLVKVCGVTSIHDAATVLEAGANALGVILAPSSRRVTVDVAHDIVASVAGRLTTVGVFRGQREDDIVNCLDGASFDAVQLHDAPSESLRQEIASRGLALIRAVSSNDELNGLEDDDVVLLDGASPGSGLTHDWHLRRSFTASRRIIGAGGLNPDNVRQVIVEQQLWGVDVASGVEQSPGVKSESLVIAFVRRAIATFEESTR